MRLARLYEHHDRNDLHCFPGDRDLRRGALRPYFENLHENKLIYYERFMALVEVEELNLSNQNFEAYVRLLVPIETLYEMVIPQERWSFCNVWENCCLGDSGHSLTNPYAGFELWPEAELVREVESLLERGDMVAVNQLLR